MLSQLRVERTPVSRWSQVDWANLGFGGVYSDHMFTLDYREGEWHDPQICPYGPVPLAPGVASLHYGQTVFEGLKAFRGMDGVIRLFRPDANARRLAQSCERLCMPTLPEGWFEAAIEALVAMDQAWIPCGAGESLYIHPLMIGTEEHLDVRPSRQFKFIIMTAPARIYFRQNGRGVALQVQEHYTRAAPGGMGFAKTAGNYAASLLPGQHSHAAGYDQALWLDGVEHRYIEEVGQMNIFFRFANTVVTPPLRGTILPGVTRDSIITLLAEQGMICEQRLLSIDEVIAGIESGVLCEAFGAGTASVVAPIGRIGYQGRDYVIGDGRVGEWSSQLFGQLTAIQYGEIPDTHGWIRPVTVTEGLE